MFREQYLLHNNIIAFPHTKTHLSFLAMEATFIILFPFVKLKKNISFQDESNFSSEESYIYTCSAYTVIMNSDKSKRFTFASTGIIELIELVRFPRMISYANIS